MSRLIVLGLVWAALSAATAYFADLWGRKLGKQRKSLFGWRPKQTAVFIITSAGAMIALLSFAVLLIANAGIRKALLQWDQTVQQLDASNTQMATLNQQMQDMREATTRQRTLLAAAQSARAGSERALAEAEADLLVQRQRVAVAQRNVQDVEQRLRTEQAVLGQTRARLGQTSTVLRAKERSLATTVRTLATRQQELREAERQLENATRVVFKAGAEALRAGAEAQQAKRIAEQALLGNLAVRRDEELVRRVVPPCRTQHEAREAIQRALLEASVVVQKRTEERGVSFPRGTKDYVRLLRKTVITSGGNSPNQTTFTEEQVRAAIADQLMAPNSPSPGGVVLQVVATANATAGEPVSVDFRLFENHIVFEKGQVITQFVAHSGETREEVMQGITDAMQAVRREALVKGLLPAADNTVTALTVFQLAETYNRVMDALARDQTRVPVVVTADADTWTAGPLRLRILVRRSEDET